MIKIIALAALVAASTSAPKKEIEGAAQPMSSIAELAKTDGNLVVFSTLLKSAGLGKLLEGPGPFTVLAPSNAPFGTFDLNRYCVLPTSVSHSGLSSSQSLHS